MTIMTPIEGITAPLIPTETFIPEDETPLLSSRRQDGWSAANQRLFLEAIAEGHGVEIATYRVGLSASSAYAFRRTAKGAAFALGWRAANLVARECIAETLLVRALEGQVDTYTRADGSIVTRHRHDNRLAMSLLARLDRQVETAPDADVKAARLIAQEFDAFLDLVARDEGPARAGLFLARRSSGLAAGDVDATAQDLAPLYALAAADRLIRTGVAKAAEVDVTDLDPAARAHWSADQWQRAEAAGLLALAVPPSASKNALPSQHSQHSPDPLAPDPLAPDPLAAEPIWWDDEAAEWRTHFPPPEGFDGEEHHEPGHIEYERSLTEAEAALAGVDPYHYDDAELAVLAAERDLFFDTLATAATAPAVPQSFDSASDAPDHNLRATISPLAH